MFHRGNVKTGKRPARIDPRTLRLPKYMAPSLGPVLPDVDHTGGVLDWGMMLNDSLGDCTIAGCGHAEQVLTLARGGEHTLPDSAILQKYEMWCGYDPADPSTDQGGVELDVLNHWRKSTFWTHQLTAYADPSIHDLDHICKAIEILGGVYIGIQLPASAENQTTWDVVGKGEASLAGTWGGHCVYVPKYRTENGRIIFTCVTWSSLLDITQDFWLYVDATGQPYIDEVHALVSPEFLNLKTGKSPEGFDLDTLVADAEALAA
jgi:hypothetical protein